ncbi:hypothetical protein RUM43_011066 [Polyplax serrata]|uniref:Brinker DNA-binding domain-containing protein n=1 Tax=Polyplax serrata TaxID=468196 RepID=A0AAN8NT28_POLSC
MAQGLDMRSLGSAKSPAVDSKPGDCVKRTRGMGSRRIFSPLFKLQVLDSYRNDVDCRGNQRATARKYNIHRRQIQKWLQCEQSLRTSVEENGKRDVTDLTGSKSRKKAGEGDDKTDATLNQSATAFARLEGDTARHDGDMVAATTMALRPPVHKRETRICGTRTVSVDDDVNVEAQNLKRVAQKLYPSLQNIPYVPISVPVPGEKVTQSDVRNYYRSDIAFDLSPGLSDKRDDNFNRVLRTEDMNTEVPLDLKSKAHRSESLPEEFVASYTSVEALSDERSDKLIIGGENNCQSRLTSPHENIGGPKLSVSNTVLKCVVQKYNIDDIDERGLCSRESRSLSSPSVNDAESRSLLDALAPKFSGPFPDQALEKKVQPGDESRKISYSIESQSPNDEPCPKKAKVETSSSYAKAISLFEHTKSFSPKRKWMQESMQEMLEDADQPQDSSSLPIKQRVKMNLRSLPEAAKNSQSLGTPNLSNFSIEKLCSTETSKGPKSQDQSTIQSSCTLGVTPELPFAYSPDPFIISKHGLIPIHLKSDVYNHDVHSKIMDYHHDDYSLSLPVKEEKVSDSEDADVDVLSTTPVEKKSFDFSGYNFGKRRSFSVQFKLTVLDAFYNDKDCNKNQRATARKFNINRRQVQKWLSQENDLRSESSLKNGKYLQRQRLTTDGRESEGCTRCPQHCLRNKEEMYEFDETIEVNVKPCSDKECLSGKNRFGPVREPRTRLTGEVDIYSKPLFPGDLKTTNFYHNYLYPDNNNLIFHDSVWSHLNSNALTVPNYQCLTTWHHPRGFDFCQDNPKIY